MTCTQCGAVVPDGFNFCPECGASQIPPSPAEAPPEVSLPAASPMPEPPVPEAPAVPEPPVLEAPAVPEAPELPTQEQPISAPEAPPADPAPFDAPPLTLNPPPVYPVAPPPVPPMAPRPVQEAPARPSQPLLGMIFGLVSVVCAFFLYIMSALEGVGYISGTAMGLFRFMVLAATVAGLVLSAIGMKKSIRTGGRKYVAGIVFSGVGIGASVAALIFLFIGFLIGLVMTRAVGDIRRYR